MKLQIALDWFLHPAHLPFVVGLDQGWFAEAGLDVSLRVPDEDFDGLDAVAAGDVQFACAGPLHMIDAPRPALRALGCFFESEGGLLILNAALEKLAAGESIRVAAPSASGLLARTAIEVLRRYFEAHHPSISPDQVKVHAVGFRHLDNLASGFDAAWPCLANFHGVEAVHRKIDAMFLSTNAVGLENAAALELFTSADLLREQPGTVDAVLDVLSRSARMCIEHPIAARELWYRHVGEAPNALTDAILEDSVTRLVTPLERDRGRWLRFWGQFDALQLAEITRAEFDALYD